MEGPQSVKREQATIKSLKRIYADEIKKAVDKAVMTVEIRVHELILTAMDNVIILRVEMAVWSATESSGRGPNSVALNLDRRDFSGNTENTPLMSASSLVDLSINQDRNDENFNVENFKDVNFPALRFSYDRQAHAHHNIYGKSLHFSCFIKKWPNACMYFCMLYALSARLNREFFFLSSIFFAGKQLSKEKECSYSEPFLNVIPRNLTASNSKMIRNAMRKIE